MGTPTFVPVAAEEDLKDGEMRAVEVAGRRVLLARLDGRYHAVGGVCTHEHACLDEGALVGSVVFCPLHFSSFDVRSGEVLGPPADRPLPAFQVRIENGQVLVGSEPSVGTLSEAGGIQPDQPGSDDNEPQGATSRLPLTDRLERMAWLVTLSDRVSRMIAPLYRRVQDSWPMDFLHGSRWLGHALHPALTDLPIGLWAGAFLLYILHLDQPAAILGAAGVAGAFAAFITGVADWSVSEGRERRLGFLHGLLNTAALVIEIGALGAYLAGSSLAAGLLTLAGLVVTLGSADLGGHLVLGLGTMVNHTAWLQGPREWTPTVPLANLTEGQALAVPVEGRNLLLCLIGQRVFALEDACSHGGAALSQGSVAQGAITCPWHGSRFRLADGAVLRGPATHRQPTLEVRIRDAVVEVRRPLY